MADANETVEATLERANRLFSSGLGGTLGILAEADANLSKRLHAITAKPGAPDLKFSHAQAMAYRQQIQLTTEYLQKRLLGHTHAQAKKAVSAGVKDTTKLLKVLEHNYTGVGKPLQLESQQHQDALLKGTAASLLRQHQSSVDRYGLAMIQDFERVLRVGALEGLTTHQVISRLVWAGELGGVNAQALHAKEPSYFPKPSGYVARRYWAERIVRTETAYAYNAANTATVHAAKVVDFPDMQKKILAHFDQRTAPDSIAVHGQVRPVDGLFTDGAGRNYKHPPARPNDRETVIPWRPHWPALPATTPAPPEAIAAATAEASPAAVGQSATAPNGSDAQSSRLKIVAMVEKLKAQKAELAATHDAATKFQAAQEAAQKAQQLGQQALAGAKVADAKALAKAQAAQAAVGVKLKQQDPAVLKAKAAAYKAELQAKAEAKKAQVEAERAAKLKALAQGTAQKILGDAEASANEAGHILGKLKQIAKTNPVLFAEMQKQAGVEVAHKSAHAAALHLGKKLQPDADWAAYSKKKKAPPVPPPAPTPPAPKLPPLEFKTVSGYIDIHDASTGQKLAYMKPTADGGVSVTPPASLAGYVAKTFKTPEEGAPYAIEVSQKLQAQKAEAAAAAAKLAAMSAAEKKAAQLEALKRPIAMNWSAKWKGPQRPELPLTGRAQVIDAGLAKPSRAGVSVAADGDFVEDFQVSFTTVTTDGKTETVARFRVNALREKEVQEALAKAGARDQPFPGFAKLKDLKSAALDMTSTGAELKRLPGGEQMKEATIGGATVRYFQGHARTSDHPAMRNMMEVRFPDPGAKKGQRWAKFEETVNALGIKTNEPTPQELAAYKQVKVLSVVDSKAAAKVYALPNRSPEAVGKVWAEAVKADPRLQEILDDAKLREVAPGHFALYSEKLAQRYRDAGITHLTHNIAGGIEVITQLLAAEENGLLSSRERFQRGLIFRGMSTDTDFNTGGADSVFLRLVRGAGPVSGNGFLLLDTSELGRLDAYAFNADEYGRAHDGSRSDRMRLNDLEEIMTTSGYLSSGNETMLRRTVTRSAIRRVLVKPGEKAKLIAELHQRGVKEIGGLTLDELIHE